MAKVAALKSWAPGSLLNDNFSFPVWKTELGSELLTYGAKVAHLKNVVLTEDSFVRPIADNKAFGGRLFRAKSFEAWKAENFSVRDLEILVAPLQNIYREYRLFIVDREIITGSLYMLANKPHLSSDVDTDVVEYATKVVDQWQPARAFVLDVALSESGYKVIEFNNIHSSGFYACDVEKYVQAIEQAFN